MKKSVILAAIHVVLALSVTAKFAYDRETLPRQWVRAEPYDPTLPIRGRYVRLRLRGDTEALRVPVAYFIPADAIDPSIRPAGEELWVEVSIPKRGDPRPIRLGVKPSGGEITPLELR